MNRQEAIPLEFKNLSDSQKQAAEYIAQSILTALEDLKALSELRERSDDDVDRFRTSQNFFVSGEPGTGKTAVYLFLRKLLPTTAIDKSFEALEALKSQKASLRWLEPLDLEPVPESANFLAAVLVRISASLDKKSKTTDPLRNRRPGLLENSDALQELSRLQSDVVLAWEGTVRERAQHVDPDVFSQDVLQAERARLQVNRRLRKVLSRLDGEEKADEILFILPIDDFYLKPTSSLDLLRLLRMISVPQLFILVLGDLEVAEELFYQDMLGHLIGLAGEKNFEVLPSQRDRLTSLAGGLASQALRKLIPPSQRYRLEAMDKLQALDFRPQRPGKKKEDSLECLLQKLAIPETPQIPPASPPLTEEEKPQKRPLTPKSLLDFLVLQERPIEIVPPFYSYSGLAILDLPPREVVDLWLNLSRLLARLRLQATENTVQRTAADIAKVQWKNLVDMVIEQALHALDDDAILDLDSKEKCQEAIQGTAYSFRTFQCNALDVKSKGTERQISVNPAQETGDSQAQIVVLHTHKSWAFRPKGGEPAQYKKLGKRPQGPLSNEMAPRPTAWFTVLHDLMALSPEDRMTGERLINPYELGWIVVKKAKTAWHWPAPAWPTFRHFDMLAYRWRIVLEKFDGQNLDWLAFNWMDAITEILEVKSWNPNRDVPELLINKQQWKALQARIDSLLDQAGSAGGYHEVVKNWLLCLSVFFHEGFAIPRDAVKILRTKKLEEFWDRDKNSAMIEDLRASMIPKETDKGLTGEFQPE